MANFPPLNVPPTVVMSRLCNTEARLAKDPDKAMSYKDQILKLEQAGYVVKLSPEEMHNSKEAWYIPHHMTSHNNKDRIVFDCSFTFQGQCLNKYLLPGPILGPTLLGVLLRFRQHSVAISGDIKGMFHQVRLLPPDKPLLRFLWRDMNKAAPPSVYEWQVLPFGTTCSPCCAIYALQKHVKEYQSDKDVQSSVMQCFYVDNCLQSFPSAESARTLLDKLRNHLSEGGFDLRQWASNNPVVISHLPSEVRTASNELCLTEDKPSGPHERTLGLLWNCETDLFVYKYTTLASHPTTMRRIYAVLARLYDPLGYLLPFTTRAKTLVQELWRKERDWDDPSLPHNLLETWKSWEEELYLPQIAIPRCYTSKEMDVSTTVRDIHIFCDASERAYGAVAYLRSDDLEGHVELSFLLARSRVAPKRNLTIPRLELCAALLGARLCELIQTELTLPVRTTTLWTDSTTVLHWLQSDSCRFKVFVGARVSEIQNLTNSQDWRYINSATNPADDVTRGKSLKEFLSPNRWTKGPSFLHEPPNNWPTVTDLHPDDDQTELKKSYFFGIVSTPSHTYTPCFRTYQELLDFTARSLPNQKGNIPSAADYLTAEQEILRQAQLDSFGEDLARLQSDKPLSSDSPVYCLSPVLCRNSGLIHVGGRLRQSPDLELNVIHPIVLDPAHPVTKLIIQDYDDKLHHAGSERLFAELRWKFWILRGREAVRRHQYSCAACQKWRAQPIIPKMSDLPAASLRLFKPPFYSTGIDCFGPYVVKTGRRSEKRWGIIFKCLTTRCIHLDLLNSMDTDSFLMALQRFISRRGTPLEIICDQGTNFKGGDKELRAAFDNLAPTLQPILMTKRIHFKFNPPHAPHFGGAWEREIRSVKNALKRTIGAQMVTEEVLRTVLIEIEGILNSKPLGYVSSDIADIDPITPNLLIMGRHDSSLPLVSYSDSDLLGRRRWRHAQILADHFWRHFIKDYLPSLQRRHKWQKENPDLTLNSVVMIMDSRLPRALWPVGRVTRLLKSPDDRIRTVEVLAQDRTYIRPVSCLIPLPPLPDED
ncbi:alcohol-forming fatty acyl-CoA reductase [Sarotherodon galilaeus]